MDKITTIENMGLFDYPAAEILSRSLMPPTSLEEDWVVPDGRESAVVISFPIVNDMGLYCTRCRGFYPDELCRHTVAVRLKMDPTGNESDVERVLKIIRKNMRSLKRILFKGTEGYACIRAKMMLLGRGDGADIGETYAASVVHLALYYMVLIYIETTRCIDSEEVRKQVFAEVRSVVSTKGQIFEDILMERWDRILNEGEQILRQCAGFPPTLDL